MSDNIELESDSTLELALGDFVGAAATLDIDGCRVANISLPPFSAEKVLEKGEHEISVTLYGNRFNSFGQLHCTDLSGWLGPEKWRTEGEKWTYGYRLKPIGIMAEPIIEILEK